MTNAAPPARAKHHRSLRAYRIMAFITGVVLLVATIGLIVQVSGHESIKNEIGLIWLLHGYCYLVYLITTVNLGFKLRWSLIRIILVAVAGTIPTMSFVAEHFVTRDARASLAESTAG
jgi:integral membrane protein